MRKRSTSIVALATILCVVMTGCMSGSVDNTKEDTQSSKKITQEEKDNFVTDFLLEVFTFNCNDRYDTLMETIENEDSLLDVNDTTEGIQPLSESQQEAIDHYYADLSKYVTEECMFTMQANRIPVQLDRFVKEKGLQESIDYIELELVDGQENTYLYNVYFEGNDNEMAFIEQLKGQITIEIIDEEVRVSSISITQ